MSVLQAKERDDLLASRTEHDLQNLTETFGERVQFGAITHGPETMQIYSLNIGRNANFTCYVDGSKNLKVLFFIL